MPDTSGRGRAAFSAILVLSQSLLAAGAGPAKADDDHSYLPPWMRDNASEAAQSERGGEPAVVAATIQIAKPAPRESASPGFMERASAVKARAVRFVNKMIGRIGL